MSLPSVKDKNPENLTKRFSDNILRIELYGPKHHHLSVVDVPGLFHNKDPQTAYEAGKLTLGRPHQVPNHRGSRHHSGSYRVLHD